MIGACLIGCSTGKVSSQRSLSADEQTWVAQQKIPLRLTVTSASHLSVTNQWATQMVSNLATNLARTGLFTNVRVGEVDTNADLLVSARASSGVMRCGNAMMLSKVTLGLIRDDVAYSYCYDFDFVSPQSGKILTFTNLYRGNYRTGFWWAKDDAFVDLLKFDLAQKRNEIESLRK